MLGTIIRTLTYKFLYEFGLFSLCLFFPNVFMTNEQVYLRIVVESYLLTTWVFLFAEREENVKNDIFHAYISLLRQTRPVASAGNDVMEAEEG